MRNNIITIGQILKIIISSQKSKVLLLYVPSPIIRSINKKNSISEIFTSYSKCK